MSLNAECARMTTEREQGANTSLTKLLDDLYDVAEAF
jgi:hypothetical protein